MEISPLLQGRLLLYCALLGLFVGVLRALSDSLCECFGRVRCIGGILRFCFDIFLVLFSGAQIMFLSYYFNNGSIRLFPFMGFSVSFFALNGILGKRIKLLFDKLLCITYKLLRLFLSPFVKAVKYLVKFLQKIIYFIAKGLAKIGVLVYNICISHYISKNARRGFLKGRKK